MSFIVRLAPWTSRSLRMMGNSCASESGWNGGLYKETIKNPGVVTALGFLYVYGWICLAIIWKGGGHEPGLDNRQGYQLR